LPHQKNGPPILIGGQSAAALKRVVSYGDGWHPVGIDVKKYQAGMETIREIKNSNYYWTL
ncbi:MAG: LLM class flavin-dependent oxidoreductase, partial [Nitrosopumilaceae archaeon]|nr:LLM class flavin-dependent oxidoreductase [Nitrosopumilaceae archaeon]NIU85889.1 LLM class flavin-dependent oxidoreductase [Nitrosopumilaceae archaeon]NIV64725.1 LLM class flavin-dependent oxidoreductase [Nitrosopumilaceae archaeon]NIX60122.1 LLM class flavin-dependent oxidoreductase [Nitrosopumilaceae archaeon]